MTRSFFNALGYQFMTKHATPLTALLAYLRKEEILSNGIPRTPPVEPAVPYVVSSSIPLTPKKKEESASEPRPKSKSEDGKTSTESD